MNTRSSANAEKLRIYLPPACVAVSTNFFQRERSWADIHAESVDGYMAAGLLL